MEIVLCLTVTTWSIHTHTNGQLCYMASFLLVLKNLIDVFLKRLIINNTVMSSTEHHQVNYKTFRWMVAAISSS